MTNIVELGAIGNGAFDNSAILNGLTERSIHVPAGHFMMTSPLDNPYIREITGEGYYSMLDYIGPTIDDILRIRNIPEGGRVSGVQLLSSNLMGRHGIHVEIGAGQYVSSHIVERCWLHGYNGGNGIFLTNPNTNGYFASQIRDNVIIGGGVKLDNLGDSFGLSGNLITGAGPGICLSFVPGAANTWIRDNNITAWGQALFLGAFSQNIEVRNNQIEHTVSDPSVDYIVSIKGGAASRVSNIRFIGNNINGMIPTTVGFAGIEVMNTDYIYLDGNKFTGVPYGVHTRNTAKFITYGPNNVYNGMTNLNNGLNIRNL